MEQYVKVLRFTQDKNQPKPTIVLFPFPAHELFLTNLESVH